MIQKSVIKLYMLWPSKNEILCFGRIISGFSYEINIHPFYHKYIRSNNKVLILTTCLINIPSILLLIFVTLVKKLMFLIFIFETRDFTKKRK